MPNEIETTLADRVRAGFALPTTKDARLGEELVRLAPRAQVIVDEARGRAHFLPGDLLLIAVLPDVERALAATPENDERAIAEVRARAARSYRRVQLDLDAAIALGTLPSARGEKGRWIANADGSDWLAQRAQLADEVSNTIADPAGHKETAQDAQPAGRVEVNYVRGIEVPGGAVEALKELGVHLDGDGFTRAVKAMRKAGTTFSFDQKQGWGPKILRTELLKIAEYIQRPKRGSRLRISRGSPADPCSGSPTR